MNNFFIDEGQLEELTFAVYGKAISMTGITRGNTYSYEVKSVASACDDMLMMALQDGYTSHENYGLILQDICSKGMMMEGIYSVVCWPLNSLIF